VLVGGGCEAGTHELGTRYDNPLVDCIDEIRALGGQIGSRDRLPDGLEPGDRPIGCDARLLPLDKGIALRSQLRSARQVRRVVDRLGRVLEGEVRQLSLDPTALDGDRALARPERPDHGGDGRIVEPDLGQLGKDAGSHNASPRRANRPHASQGSTSSLR